MLSLSLLGEEEGERKELIKWFFATLAGGTVWLRNQSEWVFKEEKEEAPPSLVLNRGEVLATPPPKTQSSRKHLLFRRRRERREGNKRLCYLFFLFFLPHIWEPKRKGGKTDTLTPFWFSFWRGWKKMHRMFAKKITRAMRHEPRISAPSLLLLPSYNILHLLIAAIIIIFFPSLPISLRPPFSHTTIFFLI